MLFDNLLAKIRQKFTLICPNNLSTTIIRKRLDRFGFLILPRERDHSEAPRGTDAV